MTRARLVAALTLLPLVVAVALDQALVAGVAGIGAGLVTSRALPKRIRFRRNRPRPERRPLERRPPWLRKPVEVRPGMTLEEWRQASEAHAAKARARRRMGLV